MNDEMRKIVKAIADARQLVIKDGGRPTTLAVSKQAIEKWKIFGLDVEVVESEHLPENVEFLVYDERTVKR